MRTSASFLSAVPAIARDRYPGLTVEKYEADLPDHALLLYDEALHGVAGPRWREDRRGNNPSVARYDSTDAATYAIASGMGIGVASCPTLSNRTGIVRVFPTPVATVTAWTVYHQASRDAVRVRAVVDLLVELEG